MLTLLSLGSGHPFDEPGRYTGWAIQFYVTFLVPAVAFMAAGGAMRDEMDRMFERFEHGWPRLPTVFGRAFQADLVPELDVHENAKQLTIEADLPGAQATGAAAAARRRCSCSYSARPSGVRVVRPVRSRRPMNRENVLRP